MKTNAEYENLYDDIARRSDPSNICRYYEGKGINLYPSIIDIHWHEWMEVVYVLEGKMTLELPSGSKLVEAGDVVFVSMNTLHKIVGSTGKFRFICLHINYAFIEPFLSSNPLDEYVIITENLDKIKKNILDLEKYIECESPYQKLKFESLLLNIIAEYINQAEMENDEKTIKEIKNQHEALLHYIAENYSNNITLSELADVFGYSPTYISYMIKKTTGVNFYKFLTRIRLGKSKFLLTNTNNRLLDIAIESGFSSEHVLIRNFKKEFGITPTEFRNTTRKEKI